MTTLTWPAAIVPAAIVWHLQANTATYTSPLTRATQTTELAGARWVADLQLPPMTEANWRAWSAFLTRLRGQAGRVYVSPWHVGGISAPTYSAGYGISADSTTRTADATTLTADHAYPTTLGTPVVDGAGQSGGSLETRGWTGSITVARAGDFISYDTTAGRTLHMVLDDAQSDGTGLATLTIEPPIRTAPADAAALNITAPSCVMKLKDDDTGALSFSPGIFGASSVSLIEAW